MHAQTNMMQRVFDALPVDRSVTILELARTTEMRTDSIVSALTRLKQQRALEQAEFIGGVWRYRRKADALRPYDRRGVKQRESTRAGEVGPQANELGTVESRAIAHE